MRIRNIALIGMPGVGKSTIGVVLAKNLGMSFIDSDLVIQEQEGKRLCELIEEHGFDGFLEIEGRVNASFYPKTAALLPRSKQHFHLSQLQQFWDKMKH